MSSTMLHFDSYHGNYTKSPYTASWNLVEPLQGVTSIGVVSIEMTNTLNNIRAENSSNTITVNYNNSSYSITLQPTDYTNITTLLTDINSAFLSKYPTSSFVFSLSTTSYPSVQITTPLQTTAAPYNPITVSYSTTLPYILGFRQGNDVMVGGALSAYTAYNLGYDSVMYMNLTQPASQNNTNTGVGSYKILLSSTVGTINYTTAEITINQVVFTNPKQTINQVAVNLVDRFGYPMPHQNALDWSFTLSFNRN